MGETGVAPLLLGLTMATTERIRTADVRSHPGPDFNLGFAVGYTAH